MRQKSLSTHHHSAVLYLRMSTEHQEFSPDIQREFLQKYAEQHQFEIIREYLDYGKSGLTAEKRPAFSQMIATVQAGTADFQHILVYDMSRWGRFQNIDESRSYEYLCNIKGVQVHYCAEPYTNSDEDHAKLIKYIHSLEAKDYCRHLSEKVFNGQKNLIQHGFRQGGAAGFGLRRQLLDHSGKPKQLLAQGEHKSIQTDRVILVAGPETEQAIVRQIYHDFVFARKSEREIAENLNAQQILTDRGTAWTKGVVHQILINEKYIGHNVWNKTTASKVKDLYAKNPPEIWVRRENAFEAIVPQGLFEAAQTIIHQRSFRLSDEAMLAKLQALLAEKGRLSALIIDEAEGLPSSSAYRHRFGSLLRSYTLINYTPERDYHYLELNRLLRQQHKTLVSHAITQITDLGGCVRQDPKTNLLHINQEFTTSLVVSRCHHTTAGNKRWTIHFDTSLNPDLTLALRLDEKASNIIDYYLLPMPKQLQSATKLRIAEHNSHTLDIYRQSNLNRFFELAERIKLAEFLGEYNATR